MQSRCKSEDVRIYTKSQPPSEGKKLSRFVYYARVHLYRVAIPTVATTLLLTPVRFFGSNIANGISQIGRTCPTAVDGFSEYARNSLVLRPRALRKTFSRGRSLIELINGKTVRVSSCLVPLFNSVLPVTFGNPRIFTDARCRVSSSQRVDEAQVASRSFRRRSGSDWGKGARGRAGGGRLIPG